MLKQFLDRIYSAFDKANPRNQYIVNPSDGNIVKTYWYKDVVNFGDLLTPALLESYGLSPVFSPPQQAIIVSTGSLLEHLPVNYQGYIVGSGLMFDAKRRFPFAKILAVRGELTKKRISAPPDTIVGDPGLLADRLVKTIPEKQYTLGFVPHHVDKSDERIHHYFQCNQEEVLIIDVQRNPSEVIEDIGKCEFILSSSLHGIVVADSLGIPNAWIELSDKVHGKGFKFFDYMSAFGMKYEPVFLSGNESLSDLIKVTHKIPANIQEIKLRLNEVFLNIRDIFPSTKEG